MSHTPLDIIDFWFSERIKQQWFSSTEALDKEIKDTFQNTWEMASRNELNKWKNNPENCLALIIQKDFTNELT